MVARRATSLSDHPGVASNLDRATKRRPLTGQLHSVALRSNRTDLSIRAEDPTTADARRLIEESQAALLASLPEDEIFSIDYQELTAPNVTFFVARSDVLPVGCLALVDQTSYGEIKRLFVRETFRDQGVAQALMAEAEQVCRDVGLLGVKLETSPLLPGAHAFYQKIGYEACPPFGSYPVLDSSLFMEKQLGQMR